MPRLLDLDALTHAFGAIARQQGWSSLHTPKNLACALTVEAGELLRLFQWQDDGNVHDRAASPAKAEVAAELADIVLYANALADRLEIDLVAAVESKCESNARRFGLSHDG